MRKMAIVALVSILSFSWKTVYAAEDTAAGVQAGISVVGGFLGNLSKGKAAKQKAAQENERLTNVPQDAKDAFKKGRAYSERGERAEAVDAFTKAITIKPEYAEAYYYRAVVQYDMGPLYYAAAWHDVHKAQSLGHMPEHDFIETLKQISPEPSDSDIFAKGFPQISAQYSNFKWGMTISEAMSLLKEAKVEQSGDSYIIFSDKLFNTDVKVKLSFTSSDKKLFKVYIAELPTDSMADEQFKTVLDSLNQKYGQYWLADNRRDEYRWGNPEKGDMVAISGEGTYSGYSITYTNAEMTTLIMKESEAQQEEWKNKVSGEAASKL